MNPEREGITLLSRLPAECPQLSVCTLPRPLGLPHMKITISPKVMLTRAVHIQWLINLRCKGHALCPSSVYQLQKSLCDQLQHPLRWHQSSAYPSAQSCFLPFPFTSVKPSKHSLINLLNANLVYSAESASQTNLQQEQMWNKPWVVIPNLDHGITIWEENEPTPP